VVFVEAPIAVAWKRVPSFYQTATVAPSDQSETSVKRPLTDAGTVPPRTTAVPGQVAVATGT